MNQIHGIGKNMVEGKTAHPTVPVSSVRGLRSQKRGGALRPFAESLLPYFPNLKKKLYLAGMADTPVQFLEKALFTSLYVSAALAIIAAIAFRILFINVLFAVAALPLIFAIVFFYLRLYPEAKMISRQRDIDSELVFAGRHMLIALHAGMPLFDSLVGVSSGYGAVSGEFRKIIEKINMGVPMGQAMREAGADSPSGAYARIMMQLANAISSGADVASSLEAVLNQVAKEQAIALKAYGQKLNPLVMFFMIFGIIFPSLGVAFAIILFSLVSGGVIGLNSSSLIYVLAFIALVQYIFLSVMETSRPRFNL